MIGLVSAGLALSIMGPAAAETPTIPRDAVIVSSTEFGSGAFTMTASNVGDGTMSLDLPAPGAASDVVVDTGSYDGRWTIESLDPGATATMTGSLDQ